jgi:2-methylisocitrate lyase-like PEP mutase family enzyme
MKINNLKNKPTLKHLIHENNFLRIPYVYDGLSAKVAEKVGFLAVGLSGNALSASLLGLPDLGILGMSESVNHAKNIAQNITIPLICDADTGFGGLMNVIRTVREFESAGISAIHIEDQVTPKRCGLLPQGIPVITQDEQIIKLKAAIAARESTDFMIIARTDALSMHGIEEACKRAKSYVHAGADAVIIMGANTEAEIKFASDFVNAPLACVIQESAPTNELTDDFLKSCGCILALHAGTARYSVVRALTTAFTELKEKSHTRSISSMISTFEEYNSVLDLENWLEIEKSYLNSKELDL